MRFWKAASLKLIYVIVSILMLTRSVSANPDIGYALHFTHLHSVSEVARAVVMAQEAGATIVNVIPAAHTWENKTSVEMVRAAFRETQARGMKVVLTRMDACYPDGSNWLFEHALTQPGGMPDGTPSNEYFCSTVGNEEFADWQRAETAYYAKHFGKEPNLIGAAVGGFVEPFVSERGSLLEFSEKTNVYEVAQYTPGGRNVWLRWLQHHFVTIEKVNSQYATHFEDFDQIPLPVSESDPRFRKPRRAYYDFIRSINDWVLRQYRVNHALWHRHSKAPFILQFSAYVAEKFANGRSCLAAFDLPEWIRQADALGMSGYTHFGYDDWGHSSAFAMVNLLAHARQRGKQVFVLESGCEMPYPVVTPHELLFATTIGLALQPSSYIYEYLKYVDSGDPVNPGHMLDGSFNVHEPGFTAVSSALRQTAASNGMLNPPVFYFLTMPETARDNEEAGVLTNAVYNVAGWMPCRFVAFEEAATIPPGTVVLIGTHTGITKSRRQKLMRMMNDNHWVVLCPDATAACFKVAGLKNRFIRYYPSLLRGNNPDRIAQALGEFILDVAPAPPLPFHPQEGLTFVLASTATENSSVGSLFVFVEEGPSQLDISQTALPGKQWNIVVSRRDGEPTQLVLHPSGPTEPPRLLSANSGQSVQLNL